MEAKKKRLKKGLDELLCSPGHEKKPWITLLIILDLAEGFKLQFHAIQQEGGGVKALLTQDCTSAPAKHRTQGILSLDTSGAFILLENAICSLGICDSVDLFHSLSQTQARQCGNEGKSLSLFPPS